MQQICCSSVLNPFPSSSPPVLATGQRDAAIVYIVPHTKCDQRIADVCMDLWADCMLWISIDQKSRD